MSQQKPHATLLCYSIIEFVVNLGVPDWVKKAIVSSLESGLLSKIVERALEDAYNRGILSVHQNITPVVEMSIENELILPTEPFVQPQQSQRKKRISTSPWHRAAKNKT